jgi:hypothetical protein
LGISPGEPLDFAGDLRVVFINDVINIAEVLIRLDLRVVFVNDVIDIA